MLENPDPRTRQALDLDRIVSLVAGRSRSAAGHRRVAGLVPLGREAARERASLVSECRLRMEQGAGGVALLGADPQGWLDRLRGSAVRLETEEMREAGQAIAACR